MSTITLENVNNHCRACLKILLKVEEQSLLNDVEMEQPAFYHTDRLKDLNKWMTIINPLEDVTHHNIKHYDKYPKYVCRSCYENFKNVNDFKDMVIHSFDVLTKLLSVDNKDDVKHLLPESIITAEISADNAENAKQQQLLVQESLTQDELIIKPEPIDDNEDEEYIMEANRGEFIENDWKMHDDAIDGINDSNELMDNNINLLLTTGTPNNNDPQPAKAPLKFYSKAVETCSHCENLSIKIEKFQDTIERHNNNIIEILAEHKVLISKIVSQSSTIDEIYPIKSESKLREINVLMQTQADPYFRRMKSLLKENVGRYLNEILGQSIIRDFNVDGTHGKQALKKFKYFYSVLIDVIGTFNDDPNTALRKAFQLHKKRGFKANRQAKLKNENFILTNIDEPGNNSI